MHTNIGEDIADFFESKGFKVYKVESETLKSQTYMEFRHELRGDYIFAR